MGKFIRKNWFWFLIAPILLSSTKSKAAKIISIARGEIGVQENPPGSNSTKYGKYFGVDPAEWCALFVSWVFAKSGNTLPDINGSGFFSWVPSLVQYANTKNLFVNSPAPGDVVVYDFVGNGIATHVGIVSSVSANDFKAIEGNTNPNAQSVSEVTRQYSSVLCFVRI